MSFTFLFRMELQGVVRRLTSDPRENDQTELDCMRQVILSQFAILDHLQPKSTSAEALTDCIGLQEDRNFNDIDDDDKNSYVASKF